MKQNDRVLIDTNAIIEATRTGCWLNLIAFFSMETVDMCARECAEGRHSGNINYTPVDTNLLRKQIPAHAVNDAMRAKLLFEEPAATDLDDGERDLLAFAITLPEHVCLICSPDKACMKVAAKLGLLNRLISLESLATKVGRKNLRLKRNYTEQWHRAICAEISMAL
ncbi:MAG: hypothetical protein JXR40_04265 [Pontiellaceae bacterium]|nr:hypothetical protein [Pontiellaceae bacterium]